MIDRKQKGGVPVRSPGPERRARGVARAGREQPRQGVAPCGASGPRAPDTKRLGDPHIPRFPEVRGRTG